MAQTLVSGAQINRRWGLLSGLGLIITGTAAVVALFVGKNGAGVITFKDLSDGSREQSGSLLIQSGSNTMFADAINRRLGVRTKSPKTELEVSGTASSSLLTVSGLKSCDTIDTNVNGVLTCGTDATGAGGGTSFNSGQVISIGDARYVNTSGDTMTGALTLSGQQVLQLMNTRGQYMSRLIGEDNNASFTLRNNNSISFDFDTNSLNPFFRINNTESGGAVFEMSAQNNNPEFFINSTYGEIFDLYGNGSNPYLHLSYDRTGYLFLDASYNNGKPYLAISGTASGKLIRAQNTLASSGTLIWEGSGSGSSLYLGTSLKGAGLVDCSLDSQTLNYNATTGRFTCLTDGGGGGTTYTAGVGLNLLGGTAFQLNTTITGSLVQFATVSGALIKANTLLTSSGALTVRGLMTGSGGTLTLGRIGASTYSTIQDLMNFSESPGVTSGGIITVSGTTYTAGAGNGLLKATDSNIAQLNFTKWTGSSAIIGSNTTRYVGVDYNAGSPKIVLKTSDTFDLDTQFGLGVVVNDAGTLYKMGNGWQVGDTIANIIERLDSDAAISRDERQGGLTIANTGTRNITVSTGALLARLSEFNINGINTTLGGTQNSFDTYYRDGAGGWTKATGATQWDNANYDDGDGTLGSVTALQYASKWFYLMADGKLAMMYGRTVNTALGTIIQDDTPPSSVPDRIGKLGILIGRIIFQGSSSTPAAVQSAFTTEFNPTLVVNHNDLAGLTTGDPHTQYLYLAGRAGGQTSIGGTAVSDFLTLQSTAGNGSSDYIKFLVGNNGGTEAMRILTNGNVAIGAITADTKLEVIGTASGQVLYAANALRSSGSLVFEGAGSGSSLYVATSLQGAGLTDCTGANALRWTAATGRFSCAADATGGGGGTGFNSGQVLTIGDTRYVRTAGGTMTGALTIRVTGGGVMTLGEEVENLLSGSVIRAQNTLASSGSLVVEGTTSGAVIIASSQFSGAGLVDCDLATQTLAWDTTTSRFSCGTDSDTTYTAGQGLTLGSTSFKLNATNTGSLSNYLTQSGITVFAKSTLTSSGTLKVLGNMSGSSLSVSRNASVSGTLIVMGSIRSHSTVSGSIIHADTQLQSSGSLTVLGVPSCTNVQTSSTGKFSCNSSTYQTTALAEDSVWVGNGTAQASLLPSCSGANNALLYNNGTNAFSCGTPAGTTYTAGQGLTLSTTSFKLNTTNTGSLSSYTTQSGAAVTARLTLTSSGGLKVLGRMSGANLTVNGVGSFSGSIIAKGTIATHGAVSGALIYAATTMASSGSLIFEGTASGTTLNVTKATSFMWLPNCAFLTTGAAGALACGTTLGQTAGGTARADWTWKNLILTSGGASPQTTSGSSAYQSSFSQSGIILQQQAFSGTGHVRYTQWAATMPQAYDGGTMTGAFIWTTTSNTSNANNGVLWGIQCVGYGSGTTIDTSFGSGRTVTATLGAGQANKMQVSASTGPITCAGSPKGGQPIQFRVYRDPNESTDDLQGTGRLIQVKIRFKTNSYSD